MEEISVICRNEDETVAFAQSCRRLPKPAIPLPCSELWEWVKAFLPAVCSKPDVCRRSAQSDVYIGTELRGA